MKLNNILKAYVFLCNDIAFPQTDSGLKTVRKLIKGYYLPTLYYLIESS